MHTEFSDQTDEITNALINFQKVAPELKKTKPGPFGMYADLSVMLQAIRQPLIDNDLVVVQMPDGKHGLSTTVMHASGQWIRSYYEMEPAPQIVDKSTKEKAVTPQSCGSLIMYQRRYALAAALMLAADDDTDARLRVPKDATKPRKSAAELLNRPAETVTIPVEQANQPPAEHTPSPLQTSVSIHDLCSDADVAEIKRLVAEWNEIKPGVAAEFAQRMAATGRKLAQFTIVEIGKLRDAITMKKMESFFEQSLKKTG